MLEGKWIWWCRGYGLGKSRRVAKWEEKRVWSEKIKRNI